MPPVRRLHLPQLRVRERIAVDLAGWKPRVP
jgi:hypothetical protein